MSAFNVKRMVKTTVVLVALAAVAAGSKIGYNYLVVNGPLMSEAGKLSARLTEAKELGMPTTKEEMETAERKEALAHYESFLALDKFLADKRDLLDATDGGGKLCAMLYEHPDQIKNLLDAASLENVDTPIDWESGLRTSPPSYAPYQRYSDVACKLAKYNLDRGNTGEAVKFINAAANLTTHLVDEPVSHAVVAWASCSNSVLRMAYTLIEADPRSPELLEGVRTAVAKIEPPKTLETPIKGDCLMFLVTARNFSNMTDDNQRALHISDQSKKFDPPTGRYAAPALESKSLGYWIDSMKSAKPDDGNLQNAGYVIDDLGAQWVLAGGVEDYLSGALPMTYEQVGTGIMRTSQLRSLVMSVVNLLSSWQQSGALPAALADNDPYVNDPLTGKAFVYKPNGRGFVLQAIGTVDPAKAAPPIGDLRLVSGQGYGLTFEVP